MQKIRAFFLLLALCCFTGQAPVLYAQEDAPGYDETIPDDEDDGAEDESDWDRYIPDKYSKGDQTINISLGTVFPTVFLNYKNEQIDHNFNPPVGGVLSLAYNYFLGANLFLGVELGVNSAYTLAQNVVFIMPIGARGSWQFVFRRFEVPLYAAIGIAPQKYLDYGYFGMYLKGAAAAYFRFNPNWSFGINADWSWYPQWPMKEEKRIPEKDVYANITSVIISARYHF
jgi:hypothetical protein